MKKIAACLILAVMVSAASAQTNLPASRPMSLQDCFAEALKNNFDVQIVRYDPQLAQYALNSAYGGYDPQFSLSGQHFYNDSGAVIQDGQVVLPTIEKNNTFDSGFAGATPWGMTYNLSGNIAQQHTEKDALGTVFSTPNANGSFGVNVTQPLLKNLWIDNNRLQILIAKNQLKYSDQTLRSQIITTVSAVESAYYDLVYNRENVKVLEEALVLAQTQLDQDQQRVQVGSLAPLDVQQDQAQVAQSRANLIKAKYDYSVAQNTLKNLLTANYSQWHDVLIEPTANLESAQQSFDVQDSWNKGLTCRPDLLQAKINLENQGIQLKYYRNQLLPEVDLIGSYGFNGSGREYNDAFSQMGDGSRPYYSYGGQMSVPLSNAKARNQLKSGKATEKQLLLQLKQLEQSIMVQIDNAIKLANSAWEATLATRQARVFAEAALDAEQKKYAVGKSTTFTVLQLQNKLTTARSAEFSTLAAYNRALTELAQAEGTTLQRRNLDVTVK